MADTTDPPAKSPAKSAASPKSAVSQGEEQHLAIDPDFQGNDADSTLGDEVTLSTASMTSTILNYRKLHGRTYHNFETNTDYWGPNDDHQNEGLDLNHHMLYLALDNKLFLAPLDNPQKVLDVGTGTGIWAIDFADEFPNAEVIGTDLSPTQPSWVPANLQFQLDDASKPWTYPDNAFDYIHLRFLVGSFKDWTQIYKECFRCLKPGGWIEHQDVTLRVRSDDGSIPPDSVWKEYAEIFTEAGRKTGQTLEVIDDDNWVPWLEEAGFADVQTRVFKTPLGPWPAERRWKEIGQFNRLGFETGLEGYALYLLTSVMGWEYNEVQLWLVKVREAVKNRNYHGYTTWGVAYAQKPEA